METEVVVSNLGMEQEVVGSTLGLKWEVVGFTLGLEQEVVFFSSLNSGNWLRETEEDEWWLQKGVDGGGNARRQRKWRKVEKI